MSKMYIAVLDEFPDHMVPTLVAHSVLAAHMSFIKTNNLEDIVDKGAYKHPQYINWLENSFKKVTVRVNQKEFDKIAALPVVHVGHEKNTLDGRDSCIVVCPYAEGEELPNVLKFAKLWAPKEQSL
jgi:hypothetical protein